MGATCERCGTIHAADMARAVGRFHAAGPTGYRAAHDGATVYKTRAAATLDACEGRRK